MAKPKKKNHLRKNKNHYDFNKKEPATEIATEVKIKITDAVFNPFDAPKHLGEYAKQKWEELLPILQESGIIDLKDLTAFESLCVNWGLSKDLFDAMLDEGGTTEYLKTGNTQTTQLWNAYHKSLNVYIKLLGEFGLTPKSRNKVSSITKDDDDDLTNMSK